MKMRQNLRDIYLTFTNDETLLRLLYYLPPNDPLDPTLENILSKTDKWDIIDDRIVLTSKTDDLEKDSTPKCRLLMFPGRRGNTRNYLVADQEIVIDILVHFTYEKDQRLEWISDRVNELLFSNKITGVGEMRFKDGKPLGSPNNYIGYRLTYEIGSVKK
jgi:hypothetical protein